MWCGVCNRDLSECVCHDLQERLSRLTDAPGSRVAIKWCRRCGLSYHKCCCDEPDFYVRGGQS